MHKTQDVIEQGPQKFVINLDNSFDIAHVDTLQVIDMSDYRISLQYQRETYRPGH